MATTITNDDLAALILRELRVWERGQPINGEYIETAKDELQAFYDELQGRGGSKVVFWADDAIPRECGRHVAVLVADRLANEFGKGLDLQQALQFKADGQGNHRSAMQMLQKLAQQSVARSTDEFTEY